MDALTIDIANIMGKEVELVTTREAMDAFTIDIANIMGQFFCFLIQHRFVNANYGYWVDI